MTLIPLALINFLRLYLSWTCTKVNLCQGVGQAIAPVYTREESPGSAG